MKKTATELREAKEKLKTLAENPKISVGLGKGKLVLNIQLPSEIDGIPVEIRMTGNVSSR